MRRCALLCYTNVPRAIVNRTIDSVHANEPTTVTKLRVSHYRGFEENLIVNYVYLFHIHRRLHEDYASRNPDERKSLFDLFVQAFFGSKPTRASGNKPRDNCRSFLTPVTGNHGLCRCRRTHSSCTTLFIYFACLPYAFVNDYAVEQLVSCVVSSRLTGNVIGMSSGMRTCSHICICILCTRCDATRTLNNTHEKNSRKIIHSKRQYANQNALCTTMRSDGLRMRPIPRRRCKAINFVLLSFYFMHISIQYGAIARNTVSCILGLGCLVDVFASVCVQFPTIEVFVRPRRHARVTEVRKS